MVPIFDVEIFSRSARLSERKKNAIFIFFKLLMLEYLQFVCSNPWSLYLMLKFFHALQCFPSEKKNVIFIFFKLLMLEYLQFVCSNPWSLYLMLKFFHALQGSPSEKKTQFLFSSNF